MNNLIIPPSANWYESSILACAPDNTLIYGSRTDIVIIYDSAEDQPSDVKIIARAHSQKIISTSINRNWGHPNKLLVTVAEDNIIKLWDVDTRKKKLGHNSHAGHGKVVGATFAGDNKVISVSEDGIIIIWNIILNQTNTLKELFGLKVTVTCISTCPHANWLTAFGLKNGLVVVTDLRKQGKVLYKLRGHDKSVLSLSWCPVPINIFPKNPHNYVGQKSSITEDEKSPEIAKSNVEESPEIKPEHADIDTKSDTISSNSTGKEAGKAKYNIWSNLKHADDNEVESSGEPEITHHSVKVESSNDFLEECKQLKNFITGNLKPDIKPEIREENKERVVIKAKRCGRKIVETEEDLKITEQSTKEESRDSTSDLSGDKSVVVLTTAKGEEEENLTAATAADDSVKEKSYESNKSLDSSVDVEAEVDDEEAQDEKKLTCGDVKREIPANIPEKEEPRREFLLASSGKEGAGTDGRLQTLLTLPNKIGHRKSGKTSSDKLWIVLCWVSPTVLLSSSKSAELIKWILPKPKDKNKQHSIVHCDHNSMLFSIAAPILLLNEQNWMDERKLNVWTFGHDRLLLNTRLTSDRKNLACYPTLGNAECFAPSPVDPNRLAIGTAEGVIKVWDLSRPNIKSIAMVNFFQKIQSKVVTLAWHPTNELILAYGTLEGRIGFLDTSNKSKTPTVAPNFFKSQIHRVEWGPIKGKKGELGLFAVAEGKLVYSGRKFEKTFMEVDTPDNTFVYSFAWKPDFSLLVVGTKSGSIILYSPELKILSTHYFQHKLKDIYWHPSAVLNDTSISKHCFRLAAVSNSKDVIVCDFRTDIKDEERIVAEYKCSDDVINCATWSPYVTDELVVCSDDGTAQLWNVENDTILSTYTSPNFEGVTSAVWSPISSDYIISAAKDHTIRVWKIADYPKRDEKEIKELRKKTIKEINNEQADLLPKTEKAPEEAPKTKKTTKTNLLPNFFYPKEMTQVIGDLRRLFLWKEGSMDDGTGGGDNSPDILKVFGSKNDVLNIIEQNETTHRQKGKYGLGNTLSLFKGDVSTKIKKAIEERRVTPWIIMMAPMVSPKLWQTSCEVYAQQLSEMSDSDPIEIATFYLACHKVDEAIDVLCEAAMYREAFVLAKCRLPEDSPVVPKIMERWVKFSVSVGNFEAAAQCYIYLGKYEDAASVLFRRSDVETLKFATELAEKSGNEELYKAVLFRYNAYKNENELRGKENDLPSKMDAVLWQHLEAEKREEVLDKDTETCKEMEIASTQSGSNEMGKDSACSNEIVNLVENESLNESKEVVLENHDERDIASPSGDQIDEKSKLGSADEQVCCDENVGLGKPASINKNEVIVLKRVEEGEIVPIEERSEPIRTDKEVCGDEKLTLDRPESLDKNKEIDFESNIEKEIVSECEDRKIEGEFCDEKTGIVVKEYRGEKVDLKKFESLNKDKEISVEKCDEQKITSTVDKYKENDEE